MKKALSTQEAYSILDFGPARGSTWTSGGCAILAHALYMIDEFHVGAGAEIVVLKEEINVEPDHVLLRVDRNVYLDGDGSSTWRTLRKRWIEKEGMFDPEIYPAIVDELEIPLDPHTSKELAKYLRRKLFKRSGCASAVEPCRKALPYQKPAKFIGEEQSCPFTTLNLDQ